MEILNYCEEHESILKEWVHFYELPECTIDEIPNYGVIAIENGIIYAMGFLRKIEKCSYAMLDGFVANPKTFGKKRSAAIDLMVRELKEIAKDLGITRLIAQTENRAILKRSVRHGFDILSHAVIVAEI